MNKKVRYLLNHPLFFYAVLALFIFLVIQFVLRLAFVQGPSMEDTLHDGDVVLLSQWNYRPEVDDIIITTKDNPFGVHLTKRVAAIGGSVYITEEGEEIPIPNGYVFLLGDNMESSRDSRDIGPIPESELMGKVIARVYPLDCMCFF